MSSIGKGMAIAAAVVVSLGFAAPTSASETLSGAALKQLFPGKFAVSLGGNAAVFKASAGGGLTGRNRTMEYTGRWTIRGEELCITLKKLTDGQTKCSRVVKVGDWYQAQSVKFRKM